VVDRGHHLYGRLSEIKERMGKAKYERPEDVKPSLCGLDDGTPQALTTYQLAEMISGMFRRVVATLLVIGWISLSGFDVIEDLDEVPGQAAMSTSSSEHAATKPGGFDPLANNMIESANRTQQAVSFSFPLTRTRVFADPIQIYRKHSSLHKLYRVFLL
jgi:hypothetical protein